MSDRDASDRAHQAWYPQFARVVWHATAPLRHALHRTQGADWWCPTKAAPYSPEDPVGDRADPSCDDCVSEHGEILCLTCRRYAVRSALIADPDGWAFRVAECLMRDRFRAMRVEAGALARTDPRGVVARIYGACADEWERRLARLILDYVGYAGSLPPDLWPYAKWLAEKARITGAPQLGAGRLSALHDDIAVVLGHMRRHGGQVTVQGEKMLWYDAYVERPLGRRRRIDTLSLDEGPSKSDRRPPIDPPDAGLVLGYADRMLAETRTRVRRGATVTAALREVLPSLLGAKGAEVAADRALMERLARFVRSHLDSA
ncbi:hypothetical protein Afil01_19820 [Actinorhabdospora filicis]|uniref:Uncharacterized protein n=1 Tax=Actinorhabdospora filicis TaxID=1785913 RepID=A0A9W6SJN5_9ACTN|nr:hypothetical protein [Actinorhabdospora filicis]GLZ77175.1 hypothetical protein Afil01_19820 [Actinorhabdospora filicis]